MGALYFPNGTMGVLEDVTPWGNVTISLGEMWVSPPTRSGFFPWEGGLPKGDVLVNFIPKDMKSWSSFLPRVVL